LFFTLLHYPVIIRNNVNGQAEKPMNVEEAARLAAAIAREGGPLTSGTFAARAAITRQAAHRQLVRLAENGVLSRAGAGRSSRFVLQRTPMAAWTFPRAGLDEAAIWEDVARLKAVEQLRPNVRSLLRHALTELVNNAIDHSSGSQVAVAMEEHDGNVTLSVSDDGVGIFRHVRDTRGLNSEREAIGVLQSGRVTTDPQRHAGEGIFFVSRMADLMSLESGVTRWIFDNLRKDVSVQDLPAPRRGTAAIWTVALNSTRTTQAVFGQFTDEDFAFTKTETRIRLLQRSSEFVSRSEARRLGEQLEPFGAITLDFDGVDGIGQGFADELFRVWQNAYPSVSLQPVNMNSAVRLMVERVRGPRGVKEASVAISQSPGTVVLRLSGGRDTTSSSSEP
jgi:anti-sigma regulatory factor (Ser/Thr protein kinase)